MFGILKKWSLKIGGCLQEVVATGSSTILHYLISIPVHTSSDSLMINYTLTDEIIENH